MGNTEIKIVNGIQVGFNADTNSYYQIGDPQYDPNYKNNFTNQKNLDLPFLIRASIESQENESFSAPEIEYSYPPKTKPILQYQWLEGSSPAYVETEIEGAKNSTYTPDKSGKYVKVRVTAIKGAIGTVESNVKKTFSNFI